MCLRNIRSGPCGSLSGDAKLGMLRPDRRQRKGIVPCLFRDEIDQRIARLQQLRDGLTSCIGCGCLSTGHCPMRNPDDRLSSEGSGARLLLGTPT